MASDILNMTQGAGEVVFWYDHSVSQMDAYVVGDPYSMNFQIPWCQGFYLYDYQNTTLHWRPFA